MDACHVDRASTTSLTRLAAASWSGWHATRPQVERATRIENTTPREPFSESLAAIPISTEIALHSTIPVLGNGPIGEGKGGVVEYASAYIDGVDSECVIPNAINAIQCQSDAIEEVCRILRLHIGVEWRGRCSKQDRR